MKTITYTPVGTCSRQIFVALAADGTIHEVRFLGGCSGNTAGLCSLLRGMPATHAIARLRGIRCGAKPTSCPDQLSYALEQALGE